MDLLLLSPDFHCFPIIGKGIKGENGDNNLSQKKEIVKEEGYMCHFN
jgi:hypothetical protein